jgi:hypothetical protein
MGVFMGTLLSGVAGAELGMAYGDPKDWSEWERYRGQVRHPSTLFQAADLERARQNIARHEWAAAWARGLQRNADAGLPLLTPAYLEEMAEITTPGGMGPCPACRDQGRRWHPNGQWSWSAKLPNQMTCAVCKTVFPNEKYPESIEVRSTWDPRQVFRFCGGETFACFGYKRARPTFTGIIRQYKLNHLTGQLRTLALAYALSGDARYAEGVRLILLRLAEVLPKYLVRAGYGYGEFADCDPHVAAERIENLPNDELVYPPNQPDRRIYTGYWSASRIGSSGMDGSWVTTVTLTYDLTCEAQQGAEPVYTPAERLRLERDVLLEGSYLAACDTGINNKSVGNRAGAAMVGLCVGHPGLVRFGIDGFLRTVDGWFLPDGGTSESAAYAMMTMSGIRPFGEALRDYSEPAGYKGPDGRRLEHFNACRDTSYGTCWQGLLWTLQGDLHHAPLADSYRTTTVDADFAELIALAYPTPEHCAYLAEAAGEAPTGIAAGLATFYRDPALAVDRMVRFALPDVVFPFLSQGYLRLGEDGRSGLAVLNASDWGNHHHEDSLDLYLWRDGHELLSDLGYLWDHPDKPMTHRTAAHNLVMLGGKGQVSKGRGGSLHLFGTAPQVKFMEASSNAYPGAEVYQRTCIQIEPGDGAAYVVDIFRAARADERRDALFHGPNQDVAVTGLELRPALPTELPPVLAKLGENPRSATAPGGWSLRWKLGSDYTFTALVPADGPTEAVTLHDGWGQRDHRNSDRGITLPYVVRSRTEPSAPTAFVTVFEGARAGQESVRTARLLPAAAGAAPDAVVVAVTGAHGVDLILSQRTGQALSCEWAGQTVATDARLAVVHLPAATGAPAFGTMVEGTTLRSAPLTLTSPVACFAGEIAGCAEAGGSAWFDLKPALPADAAVTGATLVVTGNDGIGRAYPVRRQEAGADMTRLYTRWEHGGFPARPARTWRLSVVTAAAAR